MPRFKFTTEAVKIVSKKDQIRKLGIIVHLDHGKTTTSDSLLAASGMLSPNVAGQALALDYMELEQQRQMTIKAANVTLYYESKGTPYIVNDFNRLIDLYAEPEYKKIWKVSVANMSVAFGASKDRWGFNIETARAAGMSFKDIYDAYMGEGPKILSEKLLLNEALLSMVI